MKALLVIDVQESFRQRESWNAVSNPDVAAQVGRLVDHYRAAGDAVVWIIHNEPGTDTVFDAVNGFNVPIAPLAPEKGEPLFTKTAHNAFTTTGLQQFLVERGITELAVCGIRSEQCVETTARVASDLGYRVDYIVDATATMPIEHWDAPAGRSLAEIMADPRTLGTAETVERTCYALAGRFATIRTVDEAVGVQ
ncbi:cysteine hydrolase family protein [Arthrobacter sp. 35W]|uniref:cysteine hydrolase family protein n=1 Tax=Arthrobacter sp. 35W TaxID=1132441 RepID=UPI000403A88F|nr:isochorismatase family protein [Arthrobacter sp. 35W]